MPNKAPAYTVTVDDLVIAVGDGPAFAPRKGEVSPKNEYEETCLRVAVEHGYAKPPKPSAEDKT